MSFRKSASRSEEHTSELQSLRHLVCRLLLEKKKMRSIAVAAAAISVFPDAASMGAPSLCQSTVNFHRAPEPVENQLVYRTSFFFFLIYRRPRSFPPFPSPTPSR